MTRYLVTNPLPRSGIGSNLVSLAGAVWLAGRLDRTLIVDWRNSSFMRDKSVNLFTEFFDAPCEIQSVPVEYAGLGSELPEVDDDAITLDGAGARAELAAPSSTPVLVLRKFHGYERIEPDGGQLEQFRRLRDFFRVIVPNASVRAEIDRFALLHHFDETFVVAVNIATGNGEYGKGSPYENRVNLGIFADEAKFVRRATAARASALRRLPPYIRDAAPTFVATDAAFMREILLRLPNAVTRRANFPPPGFGRGFCDYDISGYTDRDAFVDILVDHFLLARCNAVIRNASMFANYALVTTDFFNGNMIAIESRYVPYWIQAVRRRAKRAVALRH